MRIHTRLAWLTFLVSLVALGSATLLWNGSLERERRAELNDRLLDQARTLEALLPAHSDSGAVAGIDRLVRTLHEVSGVRLTVIALDGRVLAESNLEESRVPAMENHLHRPEVEEALALGMGRSERESPTLGLPMAYLAVRWGPEDRPVGVVRAALPMTRVLQEQHRGRGRLLLVLLGATALATLLGYVAALRLTRPVVRVSEAARDIAAGRLDRRVEPTGSAEVRELALSVNHLADSVRNEINEVESERKRLEQLLNGMPDGILALDRDGRIILANPAARGLCALGDSVVGRTPVEAIRNADLQQAVDRALEAGRAGTIEIRIAEPEPRTLSVALVPLEAGLVVLIHDVTRLRRLEAARREMVANIGHELRTPLSAILGYVETLERSPEVSDTERARFLGVIDRNARRLERLVRDLSLLAELESHHARAPFESVDAGEVLAGVLETLAPRAARKSLRVIADLDRPLPAVRADRHGLETVFLNLLDNAMRVSPEAAEVSVRGRRAGGRIRFEIGDRGPGVPREYRDRVFERFYRMDQGRSTGKGGSGLGLAIVKHTVQLFGGEVGVESAPGGGASFFFTVPEASDGDA